MQKKFILAAIALCYAPLTFAQTTVTQPDEQANNAVINESAFTFTEAQLGEDDNVSQNVLIVGSNSNAYASEVGYRFSAARFKYRAYGAKYNEIYINGNPVNDVERGEFRYSFVGGLNNQTRGVEAALPFEYNTFSLSAMGGSNNYNFRPSAMPTGHRISLAGANRNYTFRGMYSYNSGLSEKGWAFSAGLTYRWANMETAQTEGTFYNSLSYFLGIEKVIGDGTHAISFVTWGNPTERAAQAASTDEMYWLANNNFYNPNWGYQDGKKRNSRIIHDFAPAGLLTWDYKINLNTKLTTTLLGKYSMFSSSRLNYNNATNPAPDYYSLMPSYYYDVWNHTGTATDLDNWNAAYEYLSASKANRQLNWDKMYYANRMASIQGADAMYYQQAYHDDQFSLSLSSILDKQLTNTSKLNASINLSTNTGFHYQTMVDLLGASSFHNINTYVVGTFAENSDQVQYDMNNPNSVIREGDRFGYDYNIIVNKANAWAVYSKDFNIEDRKVQAFIGGRIGGQTMQRDGKMRNGLAPNNSYGKGETAEFLDGGGKAGAIWTIGRGNMFNIGVGFEWKAPQARNAFSAPQVNNDFTTNLKNEKIFSSEIGYQYQTSWLHANLSGYYSRLTDVSEYSMAYSDIQNSFSYISLTGINKAYYGVELGMKFKVTSAFDIKTLGTISEAKYTNNADVRYMLSNSGTYTDDICLNKGMREGSTPLTAASIDLSYHGGGWYLDLIGNYFDQIYLYYSPITRFYNDFPDPDNDGVRDLSTLAPQAKGKGGFMLDASIGKSVYLKKGSLSINLMLTNILNNIKIVTGGMEQNRRDKDAQGEDIRTYNFYNSPKKFYANGTNGMLIVTYKF